MKTAVTNVLIVLALLICGGLLTLNRSKAPSLDGGVTPVSANLASGKAGFELVSSVDWNKLKQEQVSPTF